MNQEAELIEKIDKRIQKSVQRKNIASIIGYASVALSVVDLSVDVLSAKPIVFESLVADLMALGIGFFYLNISSKFKKVITNLNKEKELVENALDTLHEVKRVQRLDLALLKKYRHAAPLFPIYRAPFTNRRNRKNKS